MTSANIPQKNSLKNIMHNCFFWDRPPAASGIGMGQGAQVPLIPLPKKPKKCNKLMHINCGENIVYNP